MSPLAPVVTGFCTKKLEAKPLAANLRPRIERLVGRLVGGRGGEAAGTAGGSRLDLRPGDAGFGEAVARLVAVPLDQCARVGAPLELRVPWLEDTLWLVPGAGDAEALVRDGVSPGQIWTASELIGLMAIPNRTLTCRRATALAKIALDGEIIRFVWRPRGNPSLS